MGVKYSEVQRSGGDVGTGATAAKRLRMEAQLRLLS